MLQSKSSGYISWIDRNPIIVFNICTCVYNIFSKSVLLGGPTTKKTSAISSLLYMAALRSRMLVLVACQLGSSVDALALLKLIGRLGVVSGDVGVLEPPPTPDGGCVIWMISLDWPPWLSTYNTGVGLCNPVTIKRRKSMLKMARMYTICINVKCYISNISKIIFKLW